MNQVSGSSPPINEIADFSYPFRRVMAITDSEDAVVGQDSVQDSQLIPALPLVGKNLGSAIADIS